jgi:hypothetical protein
MTETLVAWHDASSARAQWTNAPGGTVLDELLEVAREQCLAWAPYEPTYEPPVEDEDKVPTRYRVAQLMEAKALWDAQKTGPSTEGIGMEGYSVPVRPMSWAIKNVLRSPSPTVGLVG